MLKKSINSTISIVAIAIFGYLTYTLWAGLSDTLQAMSKLGIVGIVIILSLSLLNYGLRFLRWQWYLSMVNYQNLSVGRSLRYYFSGFAFTTTPGKAGEMVRSLFLKSHGVNYPQSLSMFFVERLSDLLAALLLGSLFLWHFDKYQLWIILPVLASFVLLILIRHPNWFIHFQPSWQTNLPPRFAHLLDHLLELVLHSRTLLTYRFLFGGLILSFLAWGAEGVSFYYILQTLGIDSTLLLATGIYAMSLIIGALSFLPGGLGGTEAAMLIMLTALGASHQDALAATLICRFATLWFAVALGALAMMGLEIREE